MCNAQFLSFLFWIIKENSLNVHLSKVVKMLTVHLMNDMSFFYIFFRYLHRLINLSSNSLEGCFHYGAFICFTLPSSSTIYDFFYGNECH